MKTSLFYISASVGLLLLLMHTDVSAQISNTNSTIAAVDPYQPAFTSSDVVENLSSSIAIKTDPNGINSSTLLYPDWVKGAVQFASGKKMTNVLLEFNLLTNEVYFNNQNKPNLFAEPVTAFQLFDTLNGGNKIAYFKNGFPNYRQQKTSTFYLQMTAGPKLQLLKYLSRKKKELFEYGTSPKIVYEFNQEMFVYDVKENILKPVSNSVVSLSKALPDYAAAIKQAAGKNTKGITDEALVEIINQLNSMP